MVIKMRRKPRSLRKRRAPSRATTVVTRSMRPTIPRFTMPRLNTLTVKRMVSGTTPLTFSTTATANFWRFNTVSLDSGFVNYSTGSGIASLTNLTEYQALFEQYKLSAFKITFRPKFSNYNFNQINNTTGATVYNIPYFCIIKDPATTVTPTGGWSQSTLNTLLEHGGKIVRADRPVSIYMKPKLVEQYGGGANRYVSPRFTDLTTLAGTATQHRGFHMMYFNGSWDTGSVAQNAWDVYITYYLKFTNPK